MPRRDWTRDELLLAMNLYCQLPFGRLHKSNADVIRLAGVIGRTPSSVAMKLVNLASLDPVHQERGVKGLSGNGSSGQLRAWTLVAQRNRSGYNEKGYVVAFLRTTARTACRNDNPARNGCQSACKMPRSVRLKLDLSEFRTYQ